MSLELALIPTVFTSGASFTSNRLYNRTIISVKRKGLSHDPTSNVPVGRQYRYTPSSAKIEFDPTMPFGLEAGVHGGYEKIHILYIL